MADENINIILESDDEELDLTNDDGEMILTDDGSAGGGTNDYNKLKNKPSINGVILQGNRTTEEIFPDLSGKADKRDTVLETTLSRGRRAGSTVGDESLAFGENVEASGYYSQAFGYETTAIGPQSHVEGRNNTAYGSSSHAEGTNNVANGSNAHVEGYESTSVGNNAHAEGYSTTAGGFASHVEGGETSTSQYGTYAHAEGHETSANAQSAHAEGEETSASGQGSHAEGGSTIASAVYAHSEGQGVQASGYGSHAEGGVTKATGSYAHSEGYNTSAKGASSHAEGSIQLGHETKTYSGTTYSRGANGTSSHSEGMDTVAHGDQSHAEGYNTFAKAQYSHAEGNGTVADDTGSHAEGGGTLSSGVYSHSEGDGTRATAYSSHSEGSGTTASGSQSHAEGGGTTASGQNSHSEGGGTQATGSNSHAEGAGTTASGAQAHAEGASSQATGHQAHAEGASSQATGIQSHAEGTSTTANGVSSHAEGYHSIAAGDFSHAEGGVTEPTHTITYNDVVYAPGANGNYSHSEGLNTTTANQATHAEGEDTRAMAQHSHAEGYGSTALDDSAHAEGLYATASGAGAHAEGYSSTASGFGSHAEGSMASATGMYSHAEGGGTEATTLNAHAEGGSTHATGTNSHAEGGSTTASGAASHAEGLSTIAAGAASHVGGQFNVSDSYDNWTEWVANTNYAVGDRVKRTITQNDVTTVEGYICKTANSDSSFTASKWTSRNGRMNYAEIIGNGSSGGSRSNARAMDWEGNERLAGNLYVGCNNDSTGGNKVATEAFVTGKIGTANGIASLDQSGKVPSSQLPSYVDDVLEYASTSAFPETGESGKIYVALDTNKTYRWSGSTYVQISESLALGETERTAYRGDRGKAAYDHAALKGTAHTAGFYKIGTNSEGHVVTATQVTKNDIVSLGIAPAITSEVSGYSHENVDSLIFVGNPYAFGHARYANRKNIIEGYDKSEGTTFTVVSHGNIIVMNGQPSSGDDLAFWIINDADVSAGEYTAKIEPYMGNSVISTGKNMYIDLWYDGNTSTTYDKRITFSAVKDAPVSQTFELTDHVYKIRVWTGWKGGATYSDYRLFYSMFKSDVTITDTGETVADGDTLDYDFDSTMSVVDTMMHVSEIVDIVDTKTYVDNHIPDVDFVCLRPEDYGAYGDGDHDDSVALQACITAAQAYSENIGKAIRGYGTYKISTGIVFNCRDLDVYLHKIIYTGSGAAVTLSAAFSKFEFFEIRAIASGQTTSVGIRCYQSSNSGFTNTFYGNKVKCSYLQSRGNTVEFTHANGVTNYSMMYNEFEFMSQKSFNANIIEVASKMVNETDFHGRTVNAQNGYLVHFASGCDGQIRVYRYCMESDLKNGTNKSYVRFYDCRSTEMENKQTLSDRTSGRIYVWEDCVPSGVFDNGITSEVSGTDLLSYDVTSAYSWDDCLAAVKTLIEGGLTAGEAWNAIVPSILKSSAFRTRVNRTANSHLRNGAAYKSIRGTAVIYYQNIGYKPDDDIYCKVSSDMTIELSQSNNYWDYVTPTTFDIDASSVTITLDASYCCIAIDEFYVIQHAGKEAIVVDKLGNTIFDGTGLGAGVFHFKCEFVPYEYGDLYVTMNDSTKRYCPTGMVENVYSGSNEKWTIIKDEKELPAVTGSDNGKVLRVVNGVWTAASLPSASGVSF